MKPCTQCHEKKHSRDYSPDKRSPDGLSRVCKPCRAAHARKIRGHKERPKNHVPSRMMARIRKAVSWAEKYEVFLFETDGGWEALTWRAQTTIGRIEQRMTEVPCALVGRYRVTLVVGVEDVTKNMVDDLREVGAI